ncbi:MAG: calcium/sodium antiporter [Bacilli bacterium]|nr:calcium/sodium antiporter [Bacilli bacterium]
MIINIFFLIIGFILLIKGADIFVDGSSSTAENFKVPKMLIGLTIIAFGTSAPEFAVSMNALRTGNTDMVLGNVIGSCILNILLILGIAAVIKPISIKDNTVKKELPLCILISSLLAVLFLDANLGNGLINQITRADAFVILLFFCVFIYYLVTLAKQKKETNADETPHFKLGKSLLLIVIGLAGIIIGSDLVVDSASNIATSLGLSERLISLTIIAFGTSLPELVTTIVSSKKGEQDLLIGNIIGSNIFNICVVLGIPVAIYGNIIPKTFQLIDIIMLIASAVLLFIFSKTNRRITRTDGIIMLLIFAIYYTAIFII